MLSCDWLAVVGCGRVVHERTLGAVDEELNVARSGLLSGSRLLAARRSCDVLTVVGCDRVMCWRLLGVVVRDAGMASSMHATMPMGADESEGALGQSDHCENEGQKGSEERGEGRKGGRDVRREGKKADSWR
eukprot:1425377-Rhodomonas_salina.1